MKFYTLFFIYFVTTLKFREVLISIVEVRPFDMDYNSETKLMGLYRATFLFIYYMSNGLTSKIFIKTSRNFQGSHNINKK